MKKYLFLILLCCTASAQYVENVDSVNALPTLNGVNTIRQRAIYQGKLWETFNGQWFQIPSSTIINRDSVNILFIPKYARVTGSNATTTGQVLADIAGLTFALAINSVYEFEAVLSVSTTAVITGTQYGVNYSVAGGTVVAEITGSLTSTAAKQERISTLNTATSAFLTTSAQTGGITIRGIVTTGANAGNLTIRHLKVTSGTSTVFINSFLKVTKIP